MRARFLPLLCFAVLAADSARAAADDPLFSGPQAGEKLPVCRVVQVYGEHRGQELELTAAARQRPALLVFVQGANRPAARLTRLLMNYAEMHEEKLFAATVWLDDDRSGAETYLQRAVSWWGAGTPVGIALAGGEGPGAYGLNRNVNLTILVARAGRVTANFALVQPSTTDAAEILAAVTKEIGGEVPGAAALEFLSMPTRSLPDVPWHKAPRDAVLRGQLCALLDAEDAKQAEAAAAAIRTGIRADDERRAALQQAAAGLMKSKIRSGPAARHLRAFAALTPAQAAGQQREAENKKPAFPRVERVDAQPLLAQVRRLREALDSLGNPLPEATVEELRALNDEKDEAKVTAAVQRLLDPLCVVAVRIGKDGRLRVTAPAAAPELVEQGWRTFLIKVHNQAESTNTLRVDSPNAGDVPGASIEEVEHRWLGLQAIDGRPLSPSLSGLELEYRVLQVFSRDTGRRTAPLQFNLGRWRSASPEVRASGGLIRRWKFDDGTDGWRALHECELAAKEGTLRVRCTGRDPYLAATLKADDGAMVLRFTLTSPHDGFGQVFWFTAEKPGFDGGRRANFRLRSGKHEYAVPFRPGGQLAAVRFDPGNAAGLIEVHDLSLSYTDEPGPEWVGARITFDARPSTNVTFRVADEQGQPAIAAFIIRDERGRIYPSQAKRIAPDFFFHPQVYRGDGESVRLPPGEYTVTCSRGPESIPETRSLTVADKPLTFAYQVKRWVDPAKYGWYSGDHHIHAAGCKHYENPTEGVLPADMARHCRGEDLKVGCTLTWGPCFDYQKQFFSGKLDAASQFPYLLRYDIEVSGFGSHRSGHLVLLRLKEQIYPGGDSSDHWPTLGLNTLRWAKRQGAVTGPAHSAIGLTNYAGRVEGRDGPNGLPNFNLPRYDGIGANEFVMDVTHEVPGPDGEPVPAVDFISTMDTNRLAEFNMWYHVLNCGFRVRASGETDFPCISGSRVGLGRVYVKPAGELNYETWCEGIREGRSYVSDGTAHIMECTAQVKQGGEPLAVGENGSEIRLDRPAVVRFSALVAARHGEDGATEKLELIQNGYPVKSIDVNANGDLGKVSIEAKVERSSWLALRLYPSCHTNPFFVIVDGKPVRASRASAAWCLKGVDQCWSQKRRFYAEKELAGAEADYEHAREVYRRILREAEQADNE